MGGFSYALITVAVCFGLAFFRIPLWLWSSMGLALFFAFAKVHWLGWGGYVCFTLFFALSLFLNIPFIRRIATRHLFHWFCKQVPAMSSTEKEAIEAGDVGWEKEVFQGRPDWKACLAMPTPTLTHEEQNFLNNQVVTLCNLLNDWEIVHEHSDLSQEAWDYLKSEKFFGLIIPKKYGGLEFSPFANSCIITKIATRSISAAVTAMVPNSLGPAELLLHYGTPEQKEYYLPRLADGREVPCFGLTSPEAGSDAGSIPDYGIITKGVYQDKEVLGIRLNFDKRYITLAPKATVIGLAFKLFDPDHLLSEVKERGITVCLIPLSHPGIEVGNRHFPLNMAFMNGPVRGKNVFIPLDWVIGGQENIGKGWNMLMECLAAGRGISLPALSTSTGVLSYRMTGAYCAIRKQFNLPIGQFEGVEEKLAEIGGLTYLLQSVRNFTISALCQGMRPSVATAISKYQMTELSRIVMNHTMDIHAGRGIMMGPNNYIGRGYQAIPVSITVEGANILTRSLIVFGQGAIRCHPYVLEEFRSTQIAQESPKKGLKHFDKYFMKHVGYFLSNMVRCWVFALTRGLASHVVVHDVTAPYIKKINWMSTAFAFSADVALLTLGADLKRKEKLSGRFADILSQLYLASSVFKYYNMQHRQNDEWPLARWCLERCLYLAQEAFYAIFENFPSKTVGRFLKYSIFPFGRAFGQPSDALGSTISQMMLQQNALRESLTQLCFISDNPEDATTIVETAFQKLLGVKEPLSKINNAIKNKQIEKSLLLSDQAHDAFDKNIITEAEMNSILDYDNVRKKAIAVDEFKPEYALGSEQCIKQPLKQVG